MGYGNNYTRDPGVGELPHGINLVESLCKDAGYNREELEGIELESKINIFPGWFKRMPLTFGERINLPEPYSRDDVLPVSDSVHSVYAFYDGSEERYFPAFTKVTARGKTKIKVKGDVEEIEQNEIILLKRSEKHLEDLSPLEVNRHIADIARENKFSLEYLGSFNKQSKEAFVFNPTSGRIFVVATNVCGIENCFGKLNQLEIEYYGQVNGFSSSSSVCDELSGLVSNILGNFPKRYSGKSSNLTKFDWLVNSLK